MAKRNKKIGEECQIREFEELIYISLQRSEIEYETNTYESKLLEIENVALKEELKILKGQVAKKEQLIILRKHLLYSETKKYKEIENSYIMLLEKNERSKLKLESQLTMRVENKRIQDTQVAKITKILTNRIEHPAMRAWIKKIGEQEKIIKEKEELIANLEINLKDRQAEFFRFQRDSMNKKKGGIIPTNIILLNFNFFVVEIAKNKLESINLEKEAARLTAEVSFLGGELLSMNQKSLQGTVTSNSFYPEPTVQRENNVNLLTTNITTDSINIPSTHPMQATRFFYDQSQMLSNIGTNTSLVRENESKRSEDLETDVSNGSQHVASIRSSNSQLNETNISPPLFGSQPMTLSLSPRFSGSQPTVSHFKRSKPMSPNISPRFSRSQPTVSQFKRSKTMVTSLSPQFSKSQPTMLPSFSEQFKRSQPTEKKILSQQSSGSHTTGDSFYLGEPTELEPSPRTQNAAYSLPPDNVSEESLNDFTLEYSDQFTKMFSFFSPQSNAQSQDSTSIHF